MQKVRNYADRRIDELDSYFRERAQGFDTLQADLETHQAQANAAVKRLEEYIKSYTEQAVGFEKQFATVDAIDKKINAFSSAVGELMEMTERVEENLDRIRKESLIVDKVSGQIDEQTRMVTRLEKRLPGIEAKFTKQNQDSLSKISTELLNQYKLRADQLEKSTKTAADRSAELLSQLEQGIKLTYDNAAKKAAELEDATFKNLAKQAQARSDAYVKAVSDKLGAIESESGARINAIQKAIETKSTQFATAATERLAAFENEYRAKEQSTADALNAEIEDISRKFVESLAQAKKTATELANEVNGNGKTLTCNFSSGWGIKVNGSYWTVHNLTITKSPDCGLVLQSGTHVNVLYVKATWNGDSGIQVYNGASYAYVYKCESYYNYDSANGGENADGYACKLSAGAGNRFVGCIAAYNSDDGWDLYGQPYSVTMTDCTAKYNGYYPPYGTTTTNGDGNGFKLGSSGQSVSHTLSGCSSYNNLLCGYDGNGNTGSMSMTNCSASGNGYADYYRIY